MKRQQGDYIEDIISSIIWIEKFIEGIDYEGFAKDYKTYQAVIRMFEIIGEASKSISEEVKIKFPDIPWRDIISMRNKIIHEYFGINSKVVWYTIQEDLPVLKKQISILLEHIKEDQK